jgi:hypothetical protein
MSLKVYEFWFPAMARSASILAKDYDAASAAASKIAAGWQLTASRSARIGDLRPGAVTAVAIDGLKNDAEYWDRRRTYGDASRQVLSYLRSL